VPVAAAPANLADALLPARPSERTRALLRDALLVAACSGVIALAAQLSFRIPGTEVPITGQTFAVLLTGTLLGWRRGALAVLLYLAEGAAGLPVFAEGRGGIAPFFGPTAGYLFAFPLGAALAGWLAERGWDRRPLTAAVGMFLGSLVILGVGTIVLSAFVGGIVPAVAKGFLPFLPGDLVKTALAALALPGAWRFAGRREGGTGWTSGVPR
jgi:biotin transport system substrate-specific component